MKINKMLAIVSIFVGFMTMPLGIIIWPPSPHIVLPTSSQFPFFVGVAVFEAIGFSAGLYFLIDGWKLIKSKKPRLDFWSYLSIAWLLMSWWPHDRLHTHVGEDIPGLLMIEYGFHLTSIVAGAVLARLFYKSVKAK